MADFVDNLYKFFILHQKNQTFLKYKTGDLKLVMTEAFYCALTIYVYLPVLFISKSFENLWNINVKSNFIEYKIY